MAYRLFGSDGKEITYHDLQDKSPWCVMGAKFEDVFVAKYGTLLNVQINPQKKTDIYAPDLIENNRNQLADLKTQNTPFFQAKERYSLDPQYAVVFNQKDRVRYAELYPNIVIYFWVDWIVVGFESNGKEIKVQPLTGVWRIEFQELEKILAKAPLHSYAQRQFDTKGNAKASYVLSLHDKGFMKVI